MIVLVCIAIIIVIVLKIVGFKGDTKPTIA